MRQRCLRLPAWAVPGLLLAIALLVAARWLLPPLLLPDPGSLPDVQAQVQRGQLRLRRLQQALADPAWQAGPLTLDEIRLALLEALEQAGEAEGLRVDTVTFEQAAVESGHGEPGPVTAASSTDESASDSVTILRLALDGVVPHGGHLLTLVGRLQRTVPQFPSEWRGCSIQRLSVMSGLRIQCLFDLYYWDDPLLAAHGEGQP